MKALKIKLFQESASYKKPLMVKVNETYPLPPYMTVSGWIHALLKANTLIDLNISIQGNFESLFTNKQTLYFYKNLENTKMPMYMHELFNVNLIIHIQASEDTLLNIKNEILNNEFNSLGRYEDLLRIDDVKIVNIDNFNVDYFFNTENNYEIKELSNYRLKNNIYLKKELVNGNNLNSIGYKLNTHYISNKNSRTIFKTNMQYVESGNDITFGNILIDDEGDIVSFYK